MIYRYANCFLRVTAFILMFPVLLVVFPLAISMTVRYISGLVLITAWLPALFFFKNIIHKNQICGWIVLAILCTSLVVWLIDKGEIDLGSA